MGRFREFLTEDKKQDYLEKYFPEIISMIEKKISYEKLIVNREYLTYTNDKLVGVELIKGKFIGYTIIEGSVNELISKSDIKPNNKSEIAQTLIGKYFKTWKEVQTFFGSTKKPEIIGNLQLMCNSNKIAISARFENTSRYEKTPTPAKWKDYNEHGFSSIGYPKASWRPAGQKLYLLK